MCVFVMKDKRDFGGDSGTYSGGGCGRDVIVWAVVVVLW